MKPEHQAKMMVLKHLSDMMDSSLADKVKGGHQSAHPNETMHLEADVLPSHLKHPNEISKSINKSPAQLQMEEGSPAEESYEPMKEKLEEGDIEAPKSHMMPHELLNPGMPQTHIASTEQPAIENHPGSVLPETQDGGMNDEDKELLFNHYSRIGSKV